MKLYETVDRATGELADVAPEAGVAKTTVGRCKSLSLA